MGTFRSKFEQLIHTKRLTSYFLLLHEVEIKQEIERIADRHEKGGKRTHGTFHSRSFPKPLNRIESLYPLRFRIALGSDCANNLEIVTAWKKGGAAWAFDSSVERFPRRYPPNLYS